MNDHISTVSAHIIAETAAKLGYSTRISKYGVLIENSVLSIDIFKNKAFVKCRKYGIDDKDSWLSRAKLIGLLYSCADD